MVGGCLFDILQYAFWIGADSRVRTQESVGIFSSFVFGVKDDMLMLANAYTNSLL